MDIRNSLIASFHIYLTLISKTNFLVLPFGFGVLFIVIKFLRDGMDIDIFFSQHAIFFSCSSFLSYFYSETVGCIKKNNVASTFQDWMKYSLLECMNCLP